MNSSFTDDSRPLLEVHADPADALDAVREETSYGTLALVWVAVATAVRLVFEAPLPLGNGEAYYYSWSRFLAWSYYDHPPLVAWMVRLTTSLGHSPAAVRLGPVLAAGAFGLLFYRLAERLVRPRAAFFALCLLTALPVYMVTSFVLNPEAPLAPLWMGALLAVEGMRERDEPWRPLAAGMLVGLAFLAKYTAILLVPSILFYAIASAPMRRWLRRPSFYAGGAVALLFAAPVILWNQARGWPSLHLHLVERAGVAVPVAGENTINHLVEISSSRGTGLLESVLRVSTGQLMAYSPLLAPLLVLGLVAVARRARRDDRDLFLAAFSFPVLGTLLAAMTALKDAEQHWTMVGFIPAVIAAGRLLDEESSRVAKVARGLAIAGVAVSGAALLVANVHVRTTALLRLLPADHYDAKADMANELAGWDQLRASLTHVTSAAGGNVALASNHYSLCGRLLYEMGDDPAVYCPTARRSSFDFMGRGDPPATSTVVVLTTDIHPDMPAGLQDRRCNLADQVEIERGGRPVAHYLVHTCLPASPPESDARASR